MPSGLLYGSERVVSLTGRQKKNWVGKVALVTGASSGIGEATAKILAQQGLTVLLVARRVERLVQISQAIQSFGGHCEVLTASLNDETERMRIFDLIHLKYGGVDVLVNNAGLGWYGYFADMPWEIADEMVGVNITAVVHLTLLFLPKMRERHEGHVINIGSVSGGFPSQGVTLYSATKSFLDGFTTALHRETTGSGVKVSVIRAGAVKTEFCEVAASRPAGRPVPTENMGVSAERIAGVVWSLLQHPHKVVYVPSILSLTPWVETCFGWLVDRIGPLLLKSKTV
jgi:uncharacterized protein